jgi:hypothetical protein
MPATNPTPAERLAAALETYWPEGSVHFPFQHPISPFPNFKGYGDYGSFEITPNIENHAVATIAAVAAAWWRKRSSKLIDFDMRVIASVAAEIFQSIYDSATEAEQ